MNEVATSHITFRTPVVYGRRGRFILQLQAIVPVLAFWAGLLYLSPSRGTSLARSVVTLFASQDYAESGGTVFLLSVQTALVLGYLFLAISALLLFLPFLNGNAWIRRSLGAQSGFVVQIRFTPRRYTGLEGWMEDADDIGVLHIEHDRLVFAGDGADIEILKDDIDTVTSRNIGWRALWLCGNETSIILKSPIDAINEMTISTRQSLTTPAARRFSRAIEQTIREFIT